MSSPADRIRARFAVSRGPGCARSIGTAKSRPSASTKYNAALSPDTVSYVGIAEDEPKRLARLDGVKNVSLLAKYGTTEVDAYKLCQDHKLLSPIYTHCRRNGCWFCPNASDSELLHMVTKHPEIFDRLIEWESEDNIFHRRMTRRETPSEVKSRLLSKSQTGFSSPKSK
jgi:3'-phosphoadenosine 5'-phosphosulfate sulfotransferase (PAPS reductase)/FAD synthetase